MSIKLRGRGCGFNRKQGLTETDPLFIIKFDVF